jgi:4-hydroxybenzoate polyprenyltransferase
MNFIFNKATLLHLRLPFSFFLLPVFCFGMSRAASPDLHNTLLVFSALHFFIYPASNSYNSYMDQDKGSIGALRNPPPATVDLYYASILLDVAGLGLAALIHWKMILLFTVYIAVSKAYSWHGLRLKKYAYTGWLAVMLFQGGFTYLLVNMCATNTFSTSWFTRENIYCMILSSLLIGGFYPLTQIYQHEEDSLRGDFTISYRLGIRGTFLFCALVFLTGFSLAVLLFSSRQLIIFACSVAPVTAYFLTWAARAWHNPAEANYTNAMRLTLLSSTCMAACFSLHFFLR